MGTHATAHRTDTCTPTRAHAASTHAPRTYQTRLVRLLVIVAGTMHVLACCFYFVTQRDSARHFLTSPWLAFAEVCPAHGLDMKSCKQM